MKHTPPPHRHMPPHGPQEPRLSPQRAFVLQFYPETDLGSGRINGRIEHVVSGQGTHFASWAEVHAFIAKILASAQASDPS